MTPPTARDIRAVIFDVDGVLVDSYDAHLESWVQLARRTGITFTEHHFAHTFGRTSADILRAYWAGSTLLTPSRIRELDDEKEAIFREIITESFPAMPGAAQCVRELHGAGILIALGSSGPPENIHLVSEALGITDLLSAVVTGRDVTAGKPDPEVFLIASQRLGIAPMHCAVVEDAPAGIEAAIAANMMAIGFPSKGRTRAELSNAGAQTTAPRLTDIARLIES
jgi:beta-phosphoglucomutase